MPKPEKNYHCDFGGQHAGLCFNPKHAALSAVVPAIRKLTDRETATVLAALRLWQDSVKAGIEEQFGSYGYFTDHKPLTAKQIDTLCEAINYDETGIPTVKGRP